LQLEDTKPGREKLSKSFSLSADSFHLGPF
jgi:hypothetical protein